MAVTVEIKTGSRVILSYLLSPLLRTARKACASAENSLAAAKARGVQLGNPKQANKREADRYA